MFCQLVIFNPLPNNKILDQSNLKEFADDKIYLTKIMKYAFHWVENIVGKGENAGNQCWSPFPSMSLKGSFLRVLKSRDCMVKR